MSSWTFSAKVDVTNLERLARKLGTVGDMLFDVTEQVRDEVVNNIVTKGIVDTGDLRDSIKAEKKSDDMSIVRDGVSYGVYNEFGTDRMAARPFFVPAIDGAGNIVERKFTELMR